MISKFLRSFLVITFLFIISNCALAANFTGDALVVFKAPEGQKVTASALSNKKSSLRASVKTAVESVGAEVQDVYEAISEVDGSIIVYVRSTTKTTEELINEFQKRDDVISVSKNGFKRALDLIPNDTEYDNLWGLDIINAPKAWEETTGSENVYIAIIDTGFYMHEDLVANYATEYARNFADNTSWTYDAAGHGTHVAGTIGAVGNNNLGITGVNWKVKIIPIKAADSEGIFSTNAVIQSVNHIVELLNDDPNMKIIAVNMSYGGYYNLTPERSLYYDPEYRAYRALDKLNRTIMVVAAGNSGLENGKPAPFNDPLASQTGVSGFSKGYYVYPADYIELNNFLVVGGIASRDKALYCTNWGNNVDISAPGYDILSTYTPDASDNEGGQELYKSIDGTSMAAPHVTGALGLLAAKYPNATTSQIKNAILEGANPNINPVVKPYEDFCEEIIENTIESWQKDGNTQEEINSKLREFENLVRTTLKPYQQLDGTGRVSRTGLLDIKKSLEILGEKVATSADLDYPISYPDLPELQIDMPTMRSSSGGSSSGCNAGLMGMLFMIAGLGFLKGSRKLWQK